MTSAPLHVSQLGACKILALGGFGLLLYFAHYAFIPIALALLLALVLSGPVEALYRHGVPRSLSALVILAVALGLIGALATSLWKPAQYWYGEAPQTIRAIKQKIAPAAKFVNRVDDIGTSAGSIASYHPRPWQARAYRLRRQRHQPLHRASSAPRWELR